MRRRPNSQVRWRQFGSGMRTRDKEASSIEEPPLRSCPLCVLTTGLTLHRRAAIGQMRHSLRQDVEYEQTTVGFIYRRGIRFASGEENLMRFQELFN